MKQLTEDYRFRVLQRALRDRSSIERAVSHVEEAYVSERKDMLKKAREDANSTKLRAYFEKPHKGIEVLERAQATMRSFKPGAKPTKGQSRTW